MNKEERKEIKKFLLYITYGIVLYFILMNFSIAAHLIGTMFGIIAPFIIGFAFAFILDKPFLIFRDKLLVKVIKPTKDKDKKTLRAGIAIVLLYAVVACVIILLASFVVPQLAESIAKIVNNFPEYSKNVYNLVEEQYSKLISNEMVLKTIKNANETILTTLKGILSSVGPALVGFVSSFASNVFNIGIALIVSIYLLLDREHLLYLYRLLIKAFFKEKTATKILEVSELTANTFSGFIGGQILDAIIIGILTGIVIAILGMPYAVLIGTIVGFTNIIPYFGPWIGSIPSIIILLMVKPFYAVLFLIVVIAVQQVDSNVIYPIVVGNSVGISALFVTFAILVGGGLFGVLGMILGVPTFAVIHTLVKETAYKRIKEKNITKI